MNKSNAAKSAFYPTEIYCCTRKKRHKYFEIMHKPS